MLIRKTYSDSRLHIILYFHVEAGMICGLNHIHIIITILWFSCSMDHELCNYA